MLLSEQVVTDKTKSLPSNFSYDFALKTGNILFITAARGKHLR